MKQLNPAHVSALLSLINRGPFLQLLSIDVRVLECGRCVIETELDTKHLNPFGGLHGGVYASLIDTAAYWAVYCDRAEEIGLVSLDLHVDNLAAAKDGRLIVEGRQVKAGRSICLAEADVKDTQGRLLAHGTSKLMILHGRQTIEQLVLALGHPPLPPKFL